MLSKDSNGGVLSALRRAAVAAALTAGAAVTASPASASDACISKQAQDAISTCPGGSLTQSAGKKPAVSFKSAPTGVNLKKGDQQTKPGNPLSSMSAAQRDERRNRLAPKVRQLLVTEIQGLESLYQTTPKDAADRPGLLRDISEAFAKEKMNVTGVNSQTVKDARGGTNSTGAFSRRSSSRLASRACSWS